MNVILTAIGSMSALCAINKLHQAGHTVIGCDIYPKEWHCEASLCDAFEQAPLAATVEYIPFLISLSQKYESQYIIPLTDLEIDVINNNRKAFEDNGIILCMPSAEILSVVRDKYALYNFFLKDVKVPSVKSVLYNGEKLSCFSFPCIAKPCSGRSSEGLMYIHSQEELILLEGKKNYIIQECKSGSVFTVDYVRSHKYDTDFAIGREELLRTKNGAGLTIKIVNDLRLYNLASYIGKKLNINGCINMEFIKSGDEYFLIDINPRFSAGIAFSLLAGCDMVINHLRCFLGDDIVLGKEIIENIMVKKYVEQIMK